MAKYRKKPVVIEALEWTGGNHRPMYDFLTNGTGKDAPMTTDGEHFTIDFNKTEGGLVIKTLEGNHNATIGDYIIKGIKGEFYPCKPDIFEMTYDKLTKREEREGISDRIYPDSIYGIH